MSDFRLAIQFNGSGHIVVVDHTAGLNGTGTISGLASLGALIQYVNNDVSAVNLTGSNFGDSFFVRSTPTSNVTVPVNINGSGGNDFFSIGSTANTLDAIRGPVTVNGGSGTNDFLQINDQGSTTGHLYGITSSTVTRQIGTSVTVNYFGIESLQVNKSTAPIVFNPDPFFPQVADLAFTDSIRAGELATLSGRLVDGDAGDVLSLTVDWGDGSAPEQSTPDRAPFSLTHSYEAPGTYTVRVIWTDSAGESNFQDLTLTVTAVSPNQQFVAHAYEDLLGRAPDADGLAFFTGFLDQGGSRAQVAQMILGSQEYRTLVVSQLYTELLRREADPAGLGAFVAFLGAGGTLEQAQQLIVASPEYLQLHGGSNDDFLAALYQDVLHRDIDAAGQAFFAEALAKGASRGAVAAALFGSADYRTGLVNEVFHQFLARDADVAGLEHFAGALAQGARDEAIIAAVIASDEYFARP